MARCSLLALVCALVPTASVHAAPPPLESIEIARTIKPPAGYTFVDAVGASSYFDRDRHVLVTVHDANGTYAGVIRADGTAFSCLTCGLVRYMRSPQVLPGGHRVFLGGIPSSNGIAADAQYAILECAPSVIDCRKKTLVPVTLPIDSLTQPPGAQNREGGISPDGHMMKWTEVRTTEGGRMVIGRLVRRASDYAIENPRVVNPAYSLTGGVEDWLPGSRYYEAQGYTDGWPDGGRTLKYGTETTALNYDIYEVDLATGRRRQLTTDLDYNENADYSPDSRWVAYASARGLDRMDVFTQLVRPTFLDMTTFTQLGQISLGGNRRCMNERWLMDRRVGQIAGGYAGQPVIATDNWAIRSWSWARDGTRALVVQDPVRSTSDYPGGDVSDVTRMLVLRFPARRPRRPTPVVDLSRLDLSKSTLPYDSYTGMAAQQVPSKTFAGPGGGTATVSYAGTFAAGRWSTTYDGWSDDGKTFVDGTESIDVPNPIVEAHYAVDLRERGEHNGAMSGDLVMRSGVVQSGNLTSVVDGRAFDHIPQQRDCPGVHRPALRLAILGTTRAGSRRRIVLEVTSRVAEDGTARPVQAARVAAGHGLSRRTDARGRVTLTVGARPQTFTARAGSFRPARMRG